MPIARRYALLDWAYAAPHRYILEDDYDSELRHSGQPVPPLFSLDTQQRVLYLSTFSQTIAPSLRIAYVCLPPQLLSQMQQRLGFYTSAVPTFEQYTLARFISSGAYEQHINRLRRRFRDKRAEIFAAIEQSPLRNRCKIQEEKAGVHFLLHLHTTRTDEALRQDAAEHGLSIRFLSDYQAHPDNSACMIFNYACMDVARLPKALEVLSSLF